jgi:hypothetical protein
MQINYYFIKILWNLSSSEAGHILTINKFFGFVYTLFITCPVSLLSLWAYLHWKVIDNKIRLSCWWQKIDMLINQVLISVLFPGENRFSSCVLIEPLKFLFQTFFVFVGVVIPFNQVHLNWNHFKCGYRFCRCGIQKWVVLCFCWTVEAEEVLNFTCSCDITEVSKSLLSLSHTTYVCLCLLLLYHTQRKEARLWVVESII